MPLTANELAVRLLNKPIDERRVQKLQRHLVDNPKSRIQVLDPQKVTDLLAALEAHPEGGPNVAGYVHQTLIAMPPRKLPPLPVDIQQRVDAFLAEKSRHA